jgi:hypothetical protein
VENKNLVTHLTFYRKILQLTAAPSALPKTAHAKIGNLIIENKEKKNTTWHCKSGSSAGTQDVQYYP